MANSPKMDTQGIKLTHTCESPSEENVYMEKFFGEFLDNHPTENFNYELMWFGKNTKKLLFHKDIKKVFSFLENENINLIHDKGSIILSQIYQGPYKFSKKPFIFDYYVFQALLNKNNFSQIKELGHKVSQDFFLFQSKHKNKNKFKHYNKELILNTLVEELKILISINSYNLELRQYRQTKPCLMIKFQYLIEKENIQNLKAFENIKNYFSITLPLNEFIKFVDEKSNVMFEAIDEIIQSETSNKMSEALEETIQSERPPKREHTHNSNIILPPKLIKYDE